MPLSKESTQLAAVFLVVLALALLPWLTHARAKPAEVDPSKNTRGADDAIVRVLSTGSGGADVRIVADLAAVLDGADGLRIVPVVGNGGTRNIEDLLGAPALADVAIVQADALNVGKDEQKARRDSAILYIAKLFNEEVHVVARSDVDSLAALGGTKVAVGIPGSGTNLTANAVFSALAISIEPVAIEPTAALAKLKAGEIAAMVTVSGKPSGVTAARAEAAAAGDRLRLLPVPVNDALLVDYVPSTLTHDDDPDLIAPGETVETISVPVVMVVGGKDPATARGRLIASFVTAFFTDFAKFQEPPRHPKWREVNLAASVAGLRRLPVALDWVRVNMATAEEKKLHAAFDDILNFLAKEGVRPNTKALGEREREALFWQFVDWRAAQAAP